MACNQCWSQQNFTLYILRLTFYVSHLKSLQDLRLALDLFYPAALGNWRTHVSQKLRPTPLRETLNRQTGMYRITSTLTNEQGMELIQSFCKPGCLRSILWPISDATHLSPCLPEKQIPLLCCEACNLFVATARKVLKGTPLDQAE